MTTAIVGVARLGVAPAAAPSRRQAHPRLQPCAPALRLKAGREEAPASAAAAAAAAPPPEGEVRRPTDSYDANDGGFEAAVRPQMDMGALSSDEEEAQTAEANYGAASCPLPPACPMPGEVEREVASRAAQMAEALDNVDGMGGNYEFATGEAAEEAAEAAGDDLQRLLADLDALKLKAAGGQAGKGAGGADAE